MWKSALQHTECFSFITLHKYAIIAGGVNHTMTLRSVLAINYKGMHTPLQGMHHHRQDFTLAKSTDLLKIYALGGVNLRHNNVISFIKEAEVLQLKLNKWRPIASPQKYRSLSVSCEWRNKALFIFSGLSLGQQELSYEQLNLLEHRAQWIIIGDISPPWGRMECIRSFFNYSHNSLILMGGFEAKKTVVQELAIDKQNALLTQHTSKIGRHYLSTAHSSRQLLKVSSVSIEGCFPLMRGDGTIRILKYGRKKWKQYTFENQK